MIAPLQDVGIGSTLTEPADAVYVKEGEAIHRGEVLALLDTATVIQVRRVQRVSSRA